MLERAQQPAPAVASRAHGRGPGQDDAGRVTGSFDDDDVGSVRRRWMQRREGGSAVLEIVVLAPVLLLFVMMIIFAGRWALAQQAVQAAAAEAARAASISRSAAEASGAATAAASASLANQDVRCGSSAVTVDAAAFGARVGIPGQVSASVTCVIDMSDLTLPGIPGSATLVSTSSSPLDTYRGRSG